ncbi:MAG TPA: peptidoglycan-binding domain-containing protein [Candidatus Paceibacterota bacterium]|nr:peptidoglycan-binding domain-containing protein [Candidatus Paceibacterota bacterium]
MTAGLKRYILPVSILLLLVAAAVNLAFSVVPPTFAHAQSIGESISPSCLIIPVNLAVGSKDSAANGNAVTRLQDYLRASGFLSFASTGYYGPLTAAAVSDFQTFYGVSAVGAVGPLTRVAIQAASCQPAAPSTPAATSTTSTAFASTTTTTTTTTATTTAATSTLPYNAQSFNDWTTAWGSVSTTSSGALHLEGTLTNNGAEAIYPTSMNWTNYRYQANVSVANGNISLIGRYVDANNFLACSFANNWVEIDQVVNGTSTVLASKSVQGILPATNGMTQTTSVAMDVQGNTVGCAGYGPTDNVTYTLPAGSPMTGGIGVESWYQTPLADKLDLESVQVTPL